MAVVGNWSAVKCLYQIPHGHSALPPRLCRRERKLQASVGRRGERAREIELGSRSGPPPDDDLRGEDAGRVGVGRGERARGRRRGRGATGEVPPSSISSSKFAPPLLVPRFWSNSSGFRIKITLNPRAKPTSGESLPARMEVGEGTSRRSPWRQGRHRVHYSLLDVQYSFILLTIGQTFAT